MKKSQHQIVYRKLSELKKLPNNPRTIKKDDMERLKKSVKDNPDYFEARPVILSDRTGEVVIIAGNQRFEAAKALGLSEIPTVLLEGLTEEREREIIIRDNVANGDWDMDILANEWDADELVDWGVEVDWNTPEEIVEDEAPEVDEAAEPESKRGEIYQLGEHKLMCGDSTVGEDIERLMGGVVADMVFTDPPYGVSYTGGIIHGSKININHKREMLKNDDSDMYKKFIPIINRVIGDGAIYIFYATVNSYELFKALKENNLELNSVIVWNKVNTGYADMNSNYKNKYEPFVYCKRKGHKLNFVGPTDESTVWDIKKDRNNKLHPTQKPVSIASRAIKNSSMAGDIVLDLFGGGGSTLIACEQLDRRCYMMELDQRYCDVIRKRYWKFKTGSEEGWQEGTPCLKK